MESPISDATVQHLDKRFDRLETRLDQLDEKLEDHLGRISSAETELSWVKGAGKFVLTLILSALGFLAQAIWTNTGK
jgi:hypothetical protein